MFFTSFEAFNWKKTDNFDPKLWQCHRWMANNI